jgi:bla regulator protein BlaR1
MRLDMRTRTLADASARRADRAAQQADREAAQAERDAARADQDAEQADHAGDRAELAARRAELRARIAADAAELRALERTSGTRQPLVRMRVLPTPPRAPRAPRAPAAPAVPQLPQVPTPPAPAVPAPPAAPDQARPVPPPPGLTRAAMGDELRRQGLLKPTDKNFDFEIGDKGGRLNGRTLTPAQTEQLRGFMELPAGSSVHMVLKEK